MALLEEEYRLVHSLEPAEKRFVKLLGRATAGGDGGQLVQLFDMLNGMPVYAAAELAANPTLQGFRGHQPTLSRRLREWIFKSLQYLASGRSVEGVLSRLQHAANFHLSRRQFGPALKISRRGQAYAERYGRYAAALPFLDLRRQILLATYPHDVLQQLTDLHAQSQRALDLASRQESLRHFQHVLLAQRKQAAAARTPESWALSTEIAVHAAVQGDARAPDLFTASLALDVQGLLALAQKRGEDALSVYTELLARWQQAPEWIRLHGDFYLTLFQHYQIAIFWGTMESERLQSYLDLLPALEALPPKNRLDFARIQHGHLLTLGLNTGNFALVLSQVPRIRAWLQANAHEIPAATQLAFHYNLCIAFFLNGDFVAAYHQLQPILQFPQRNVREDILEFARVLQAVLLFQLGDHDLSDYLRRSAHQFFKRNPRQWAFEEAVLSYLGALIARPDRTDPVATEKLAAQLATFAAESSRPYPLLGLAEIRCWVAFRQGAGGIREVFLRMLDDGPAN